MVVKLLFPSQEDIGHLLLALPAARRGTGQRGLSLVTSTVLDMSAGPECWNHIPGEETQLDPPTLVLLWANDHTPLCLDFHICPMVTPFHMVGFLIPQPPRATEVGVGVQGLLTSAAASLPALPGSPDEG